jgi:hypothetical protein
MEEPTRLKTIAANVTFLIFASPVKKGGYTFTSRWLLQYAACNPIALLVFVSL